MQNDTKIASAEGSQLLTQLSDLGGIRKVRSPCLQIIGCSAPDTSFPERIRELGSASEELGKEDSANKTFLGLLRLLLGASNCGTVGGSCDGLGG